MHIAWKHDPPRPNLAADAQVAGCCHAPIGGKPEQLPGLGCAPYQTSPKCVMIPVCATLVCKPWQQDPSRIFVADAQVAGCCHAPVGSCQPEELPIDSFQHLTGSPK